MAAANYICTHCAYEGKPVKPPSDAEMKSDDVSKSLARVVNLVIPGAGLIIKPLAMLVSLPIYILMWVFAPWVKRKKHCPNCGLPLMVHIKSDAGWLAKRKLDIKMGLVVVGDEKKPTIAFGKEIILPGDEPAKAPPVVAPTQLPSLDKLLEEKQEETPAAPAAPSVNVTKKPVDPEAW